MALVGTGRRGGGFQSERRAETVAALTFIVVPMFFFLVLRIGAILYAGWISLWDWGLRGPRDFIGLANYEDLLTDSLFHRAIGNSLYYTAVWVPLTMALGLFLAVVVNQKIRGQTFFRAAFYFPAIASSAAITVLFIFIMNPDGLFNGFRQAIGPFDIFGWFGIPENHTWLFHSTTALES